MNKIKYKIDIKYLNGESESTIIETDDIKWSINQYIRNRKAHSNLLVETLQDGKETGKEEQRNLPR